MISGSRLRIINLLRATTFHASLRRQRIQQVVSRRQHILRLIPRVIRHIPPINNSIINTTRHHRQGINLNKSSTLHGLRLTRLRQRRSQHRVIVRHNHANRVSTRHQLTRNKTPYRSRRLTKLRTLNRIISVTRAHQRTNFRITILRLIRLFRHVIRRQASNLMILLSTSNARLMSLNLHRIRRIFNLQTLHQMTRLHSLNTNHSRITRCHPLVRSLNVMHNIYNDQRRHSRHIRVINTTRLIRISILRRLINSSRRVSILQIQRRISSHLMCHLILQLMRINSISRLTSLTSNILTRRRTTRRHRLHLIIIQERTIRRNITSQQPHITLRVQTA